MSPTLSLSPAAQQCRQCQELDQACSGKPVAMAAVAREAPCNECLQQVRGPLCDWTSSPQDVFGNQQHVPFTFSSPKESGPVGALSASPERASPCKPFASGSNSALASAEDQPRPSAKGTGKGRAVTKQREYLSCKQCRKRRIQCSREDPCRSCNERGEAGLCDWSDAKPTVRIGRNRFQNDSEDMFKQINRLVSALTRFTDHQDVIPRSNTSVSDAPRTVPVEGVSDLATELSNMTINNAVPLHRTGSPEMHGEPLMSEARTLLLQADFNFFFGPGVGILGLGEGPRNVDELFHLVPSKPQMFYLYTVYEQFLSWMHRILHKPTFDAQLNAFQLGNVAIYGRPEGRPVLHWIAIVFAVCGLAMHTDYLLPKDCVKVQLPVAKYDQTKLGRKWLQCATSALQLGNFMSDPTLDVMRAMAVLIQFPLYTSNGENLGTAISFIDLALHLASRLKLNTDPNSLNSFKYESDLVKHDRRRIMYALLGADWKMGGLLCKRWGLKSPDEYQVELPFDNWDIDFDGRGSRLCVDVQTQTPFTALRARIRTSRVWQQIQIALSNPQSPPTHDEIMRLDRKLQETEQSFPACIKTTFDPKTTTFTPFHKDGDPVLAIDRLGTYAVVAGAHIRLHRGFLVQRDGVPIDDVKLHRERVLYHGRLMIALERTGFYPLECVPLQFFILSAAIALAVYLLTAKPYTAECEAVEKEIGYICSFIGPKLRTSSILRRSYGVLQMLLGRVATISEANRRNEVAKRFRDFNTSGVTTGIVNTLVATTVDEPAADETELYHCPASSWLGSNSVPGSTHPGTSFAVRDARPIAGLPLNNAHPPIAGPSNAQEWSRPAPSVPAVDEPYSMFYSTADLQAAINPASFEMGPSPYGIAGLSPFGANEAFWEKSD